MKDKILVIRSDGQLGTELKQVLPNAVFTGSRNLGITDSKIGQQ